MVKMTIKRADSSTEDKKWVCKRIDDDLEPATVREADESQPPEDENLKDETGNADNWYQTIPSYLEIEMKEGENQEPSWTTSTENNGSISMAHCPASSSVTMDSASTSCNDPMDLSTSHSKFESQRDITNVSYKNPPEAHASKSKFLGNVYAEGRNTPGLTGADRIPQSEPVFYLPRTMWSANTHPMALQSRINSGVAFAMPARDIPSTSYNFPRNPHEIFPDSGFVNTEKPEIPMQGNIPQHLTQDALNLKTNYKPFSSDMVNYGHYSNEPHSNANRSYSWSLRSEGNANAIPLRNVSAERTGDNFANNPPQNKTNNLKRPSENCEQMVSSDASKSVCPLRKKQSRAEVTNIAYYCNVCGRQFKNNLNYINHCATKQHHKKMQNVSAQLSKLSDFQPNSEGRPLGTTNLQVQSLPLQPPHIFQPIQLPMWNAFAQALPMTNMYLFGASKEKINSTDVQKSGPETSKVDCNEEPLDRIRSQNHFGTECNPQNPRHMNLPVSHTNNPQGLFLPPRYPQPENSMMANPKLENKASQRSQARKDTSVQIQPDALTAANSSRKSGDVPSVTHHQENLFRIFKCVICSFKTDSLQQLELHINTDRSRTPLDLVIFTVEGLVCKLCDFKSKISEEMAQHCTSEIHLYKVRYYNHVREGGIHRTQNIFAGTWEPKSVWVFCEPCEYSIKSMVVLKAHATSQNHQYNVSCSRYIESVYIPVEYCLCKLCNLQVSTNRKLLVHTHSQTHRHFLQLHLSQFGNFPDPRYLFYFKEISLNNNEPPRVSGQNEGNTFIGREEPHLKKEKNEERNVAENLASVNLGSVSSTFMQPVPVSCSLCQEVFPEINVLVHHLLKSHGVSEEEVKWFVPKTINMGWKVHEEKTLPEKDLTDTKSQKLESIWADKSSATNEALYQSFDVIGKNEESESSGCSRAFRSGQNVATDKNFNQEKGTYTSSSQQFNETERMQNADKLDQNLRLNPYGRTCIHPSSSQEIHETEVMQNPDLHQEKMIHLASTTRQQFCKTKNILPVEEKNVPNSEERLNYNSSQEEITVISELETSEDGKYETEMNDSSSDEFASTETGSLKSHSVFNTSIESNDFLSTDDSSVPYERLPAKEKPISSAGRNMVVESSSSQHDALDSQNTRSPLEYQPNRNVRRNAGNHSPTNNLTASVETNRKANNSNSISVNIESLDDSVNERMVLNDRSNESEAQFCAQNSPTANDPQTQAMENIKNIEISSVVSLRGCVDNSSDTDEDEGSSDLDIYSDL